MAVYNTFFKWVALNKEPYPIKIIECGNERVIPAADFTRPPTEQIVHLHASCYDEYKDLFHVVKPPVIRDLEAIAARQEQARLDEEKRKLAAKEERESQRIRDRIQREKEEELLREKLKAEREAQRIQDRIQREREEEERKQAILDEIRQEIPLYRKKLKPKKRELATEKIGQTRMRKIRADRKKFNYSFIDMEVDQTKQVPIDDIKKFINDLGLNVTNLTYYRKPNILIKNRYKLISEEIKEEE